MKRQDIPEAIFKEMSGGSEVIILEPIFINGKSVDRKICKINAPSVAEDCGWLRFICSSDGSFDICGVELHATEERARLPCKNKPDPDIVCFVLFIKVKYYLPKKTGIIIVSPVNYKLTNNLSVYFLASEPSRLASILQS